MKFYQLGYFTITIKPLNISIIDIESNTQRKKIERVCRLDTISQTYTMSVYLIAIIAIAQLGKNFTNELNKKISGKELLNTVLDIVKKMQYLAGGMITFVETENNTKLNLYIFTSRIVFTCSKKDLNIHIMNYYNYSDYFRSGKTFFDFY